MKKLLLLMALLWGGGSLGVWFWTDRHTHRVSYRTVKIQRGRSPIHDQRHWDNRTRGGRRCRCSGRWTHRELRRDPSDPQKTISYGSPVERSTVLARLDCALFQARVDQTRGQVLKAEADIEQVRAKLWQSEARSRAQQATSIPRYSHGTGVRECLDESRIGKGRPCGM